MDVRVWAPGRVNIIGEHTDYTGGFALPIAIQLGITLAGSRLDGRLRLATDFDPEALDIALPVATMPDDIPRWGRAPTAVAIEAGAAVGLDAALHSDLPAGSGLSSSAALEVAVALALGVEGTNVEIAKLCQRAEHLAGSPCGLLDQLASIGGVAGHALLMDCRAETIDPIPVPPTAQITVVDSGQRREVATSGYADRPAECARAEAIIGPLREVHGVRSLDAITDEMLRARARHVVTENRRVLDFVDAFQSGDLVEAGRLMVESHSSLRDDYEVSTDALDALVESLVRIPGVYGARLTGAGFGGNVIALCDVGTEIPGGWTAVPSDGARRL